MARGSRYGIDRLVGPVTMDQNSYIDIAKARLHIGNVVPVPNYSIIKTSGTSEVLANFNITLGLNDRLIQPGDLMRLVNLSSTTHRIFFRNSAAQLTSSNIHILGNSEIFVVIPPNSASLHFGVALTSSTGVAIEITLDN